MEKLTYSAIQQQMSRFSKDERDEVIHDFYLEACETSEGMIILGSVIRKYHAEESERLGEACRCLVCL